MAIWVDGWIRCGFGGAEGWWQQQTWPFLPDRDICDWEHSWVDLSAAYSAKCQLTKFLASLEELSVPPFLVTLERVDWHILEQNEQTTIRLGKIWLTICPAWERRGTKTIFRVCGLGLAEMFHWPSECLPRLPERLRSAGGQMTSGIVQVLML